MQVGDKVRYCYQKDDNYIIAKILKIDNNHFTVDILEASDQHWKDKIGGKPQGFTITEFWSVYEEFKDPITELFNKLDELWK